MARFTNYIPADPEGHIWDVIVVGAGAGGATAGLNLARLGHSVLFIDQGKFLHGDRCAEEMPAIIRSKGSVKFGDGSNERWGQSQDDDSDPAFVVGTGIGGTTSIFSMVMDRFRPVDFTPRQVCDVPLMSTAPESWPIQYEELEPYYREAEDLFRVRGSADPLMSTSGTLKDALSPSFTETVIHDTLAKGGLHPYRLHYAREYALGCDGCLGRRCPYDCRNDAGRMCVVPAIERYGAHILPEAFVFKLKTSGRTVQEAICAWNGRRAAIRGKVYILALNALLTPALLLRSASELFPEGLGNSSGMVGRNLMAHVSDTIEVRFRNLRGRLNEKLHNGLSLNDFYLRDRVKLGNIHVHAMRLDTLGDGGAQPGRQDSYAGTAVFSTIVEDFPYIENRVVPRVDTQGGVDWTYEYPDELRRRSTALVESFSDAIQPWCETSVRNPSGMLNASHVCGTCRFGEDPRCSVLDRNNRIHDIDNAYVVDASFFPSSGGINPSLTIVANSLRVSKLIASR